ncbi:hypothetical protein KO116_00910 [Halomonas sp. KO116]|nr:hypothetical protein KO116_00910 [Halomonas sp. KO116]
MTAESALVAVLSIEKETLYSLLDRAESGEFSLIGKEVEEKLGNGALDAFFQQLRPSNYEELSEFDKGQKDKVLLDNFELKFKVQNGKVEITAIDNGLRSDAYGQSKLIYASNSTPFQSPVVGCEGVSSGGGSTFSSYRSNEGAWNGEPGNFVEQDTPLIRTTADNANVVLGGNEKIHGGIEALGTITLNGSSQVFGSILANQTIYLNGGGAYVERNTESLADVIFGSSARVDGVVRAQGDVRFNNYSASVGEGIYAGGNITSDRNPVSDHIDPNKRANFSSNSDVSLNRVEEQPCDIVDFAGNSLSEEIARYQEELTSIGDITVGAYPNVEWRFSPQQIERYDQTSNINRWVSHASPELNTLFGEQASIYRLNSLKLTSSSSLRVTGGNVVIVIDEDFTMGGGGAGLVIDGDSSLTVFVEGKVDFGSVLNMPEINSINSNGESTFSIFSGYSGSDTGVNFHSSNRVVANVYAPYTNVSVNSGANFFGSVRGRNVNVSGNGSIVYDEVLGGAFGDPDEVWKLVGWQ